MKKGLDTKLGFRSIWAQEFRNLLVFIGCFQQWSEWGLSAKGCPLFVGNWHTAHHLSQRFVVRVVQIQRSAKFEPMGCTYAYCPLVRYLVSGSRCTTITTKKGVLEKNQHPTLSCLCRLSLRSDSLWRTYTSTSTAVDTLAWVDYIDIASRDSLNWTLVDASTACNARIWNFVSHNIYVLKSVSQLQIYKLFQVCHTIFEKNRNTPKFSSLQNPCLTAISH